MKKTRFCEALNGRPASLTAGTPGGSTMPARVIFLRRAYTLSMADTKQKSGKSAPGRRTAAKALNKKAAGTDAAGKTEDGGRDALAGELRSLIPRLDAEGLSFLIEQAQVHLYNMQVEELNKAVVRAESAAAKPAKRKDRFRLEGSGSRSSYYIVSVHKVGYFADRPCIFSPKGCENAFFMEVCL